MKKRSDSDKLTEADGRQLAADMLRELGEQWNAFDLDGVPDADIREVMVNREPDTLRRYLATVRAKKSRALERGFLCALSEFISREMAMSDELNNAT